MVRGEFSVIGEVIEAWLALRDGEIAVKRGKMTDAEQRLDNAIIAFIDDLADFVEKSKNNAAES